MENMQQLTPNQKRHLKRAEKRHNDHQDDDKPITVKVTVAPTTTAPPEGPHNIETVLYSFLDLLRDEYKYDVDVLPLRVSSKGARPNAAVKPRIEHFIKHLQSRGLCDTYVKPQKAVLLPESNTHVFTVKTPYEGFTLQITTDFQFQKTLVVRYRLHESEMSHFTLWDNDWWHSPPWAHNSNQSSVQRDIVSRYKRQIDNNVFNQYLAKPDDQPAVDPTCANLIISLLEAGMSHAMFQRFLTVTGQQIGDEDYLTQSNLDYLYSLGTNEGRYLHFLPHIVAYRRGLDAFRKSQKTT